MDVTETGTAYVVQLEIPGIDPASVTITISHGMLAIAGEKTEETEETEQDYHVSERRWGSFQRAIRMPENVDDAKIEATSAKGVLTITLPKSADARSADRKIPVKVGQAD
jgi:HSP20 family protein